LVLAASRRTELAGLRIVDGQVQGDGCYRNPPLS
jgi:hypothetical protein